MASVSNGSANSMVYFAYNAQGDVIGLYGYNGTLYATYDYDAWGNCTVTPLVADTAGHSITDANHIAHINPFRYRGYYYDTETGLYYLQSRYYDPQTGRFLNADSQLNPDYLGNNVFAYCSNNPVKRSDSTGLWFGFDDIFTGPVDEILVLGGLGVLSIFGVGWASNALAGAQQAASDAWNSITNSFNNFISDYSVAASAEDELGRIAGEYGNKECVQAAKEMMKYLVKKAIPYGVVEIQFIGGRGYVVSVSNRDRVISDNGYHTGVFVNDRVFCNVHPLGLPLNEWIADFEGTGVKTVSMIM